MPRLRELFAPYVPIPEVSALTLLISPTLRVVRLSFVCQKVEDADVAPHVVGSLLHTLPVMAPDLENFSYNVDFSPVRRPVNLGYEHLESFRLHFTRLTTLTIIHEVALDSDHVLRSLSSVPTLQDLACNCIVFPSGSVLALPQCTFQQLICINLGGHLDPLVALFQACQFPSLASITLRITRPSNVRGTRESLTNICRRCNPALLTSFSLESLHVFSGNSPPPSNLVQYFEPLLAFPNVTSFHFYCFHVVPPVHDDDLASFGAAWPRLVSFVVSHCAGEYSLPDVPRPTLSALVELARRCPRLDTLHIPELDATVVPERNAAPLLNHRLRYLMMMNVMTTLPPSVYMEVAVVLDRVFPAVNLQSSRTCIGRVSNNILQFMEAMRLGRETAGLYADLLQREGET